MKIPIQTLAERDIHVFLKAYAVKTENGSKFDLPTHRFLIDPLADMSPLQCCQKSAQCGWSTLMILKTLWLAKRGLSIAYTLPTASDAQEFCRTKVNRIIQNNPILREWVSESDNLGDKLVGKANIFYRGSYSERQAISFTADLLCFDEVDRSDQRVLGTYASRLQHSKYKWQYAFSNPSVPGNGVSRFWEQSDQKHWFVKCKNGHEQYLDWPDSICRDRGVFQCLECAEEITDEQRRMGRWVNKFRGREWSGYWVSQLICPWVSAKDILKSSEDKSAEFLANFVIGKPYIGQGNTITPEMFFRNCTTLTTNSQEEVVIGCDSGLLKHYVVGNKEGLFFYGKAENWDAIESLLARFPRSVAVIDALPDLSEPRKLREKYPGRVFLAHYVRDRKTLQFVRWGEHEESGNVNIDRNRMIQLVVDELADGRISVQGTRDDWSEFYSHLKTMYRLEDKDAQGNSWQVWESSDGKDHWLHALCYWRVGMSKFSGEKAHIIGGDKSRLGLLGAKESPINEIGVGTFGDPLKLIHKQRERDWRL